VTGVISLGVYVRLEIAAGLKFDIGLSGHEADQFVIFVECLPEARHYTCNKVNLALIWTWNTVLAKNTVVLLCLLL